MFGSNILEMAIGVIFVYLLLSLICTALNEGIASLLDKRPNISLRDELGIIEKVFNARRSQEKCPAA